MIVAAMVAAAASPWAWAPQGWWPLIPLAFGVLLHAAFHARTLRSAFCLGWGFGTVAQLVGHRWMYTAMTAKAGLGHVEAALEFGALGLYLGLSTGVAVLAWKTLLHHENRGHEGISGLVRSSVSFAVLLTLAEWSRALAFGGFSSLSVGYAFVDTWMRGYIPIGGVWCASFAVLLATALACGLPWLATRVQLSSVSLVILGLLAGGAALASITWVQPSGTTLSYRLLQPNVNQDIKFDPAHVTTQLEALTSQLTSGRADIVLTPETAVPLFFTQLPAGLTEQWQAWSTAHTSHLFVGMPILDEAGMAHNAMLHINPDAQALETYEKVRLMPFGEYTPKGLGWTTRDLAMPLKDLVPGSPDQIALHGPGHEGIGVLMCQEELMGADVRRSAVDAGVILNPSNLAWFDESAALAQRLQIVRVRALEIGRPILRSANTGITAHIDHTGQVKTIAPVRRPTILRGEVQTMRGRTPYAALGDTPFVAAACLWLCLHAAVTSRFTFGSEDPRKGERLRRSGHL